MVPAVAVVVGPVAAVVVMGPDSPLVVVAVGVLLERQGDGTGLAVRRLLLELTLLLDPTDQ